MDEKDYAYEKALRDIRAAEKAASLPYDWFVTKEHATRANEIIQWERSTMDKILLKIARGEMNGKAEVHRCGDDNRTKHSRR